MVFAFRYDQFDMIFVNQPAFQCFGDGLFVAELDAVFQPLELILPERIGRCYLIDFGNLFAG